MSWITLTPTDLQAYLAALQLEALQQTLLATGQSDPLPGIIADVAQRVRAEVRAFTPNRLSVTPLSIPPELKGAAAYLCLETAQTRLPSLQLTTDQKRAADNARHLLVRVARGEILVTQPSDPEPAPSGPQPGSAVIVSQRKHQATGPQLQGL